MPYDEEERFGPTTEDEDWERAKAARQRLRDLPLMSGGPRDVRRGQRWLDWHDRLPTISPPGHLLRILQIDQVSRIMAGHPKGN